MKIRRFRKQISKTMPRAWNRDSDPESNQSASPTEYAEHKIAEHLENAVYRTGRGAKRIIKTSKNAARQAKAAAAASSKTAKASAAAAKTASKTVAGAARGLAKAIAVAAESLAAAGKGLAAAVAAGGWISTLAIFVIILIASSTAYLGFVLFGEHDGADKTLQVVAKEISEEYRASLEEIVASVEYDAVQMPDSGTNWPDVLSVYAVMVTTDPNGLQQAVSMTPEKEQLLRDLFHQMHEVSYALEDREATESVDSEDEDGNSVTEEITKTERVLVLTIVYRTADEMAELYHFDEQQLQYLHVLLEEGIAAMWAQTLGVGAE